tara:strand:+ start:474 stop:899 length:426 start_codon:yes stop_codon:yes gene_type:complete
MTKNELEALMSENVIVVYDGICGFCNKTIQVILTKKPSKKLKFVSFQSKNGIQILKKLNIKENMDSILVIEESAVFIKANAIFILLKHIESPLKFLYYLKLFPSIITNFVYDFISKNRYSLQRKSNTCRLLTKEEKDFFLK